MTPLSEKEIQQFRKETRGTAERIHFNNAGSSLTPDSVVETVVNYLTEEAKYGGYETEAKYRDQLEKTYDLIAQLINADRDEIAVVESASVAWGLAFKGIQLERDDVVITSEMEYVTNVIGFLHAQKTHGIKIKVIPNDAKGNFFLSALESAISAKTKLIAVTHIASTAGGIIPVAEIGVIARRHGILYLVDACQSAGQLPIDVKEMKCDMLSVTGRKYLRAPRGTGFLFVRKEIRDRLQPVFMDGFTTEWVSQSDYKIRDDGRRFELYENNRALTVGLGKAVEYALSIGVNRIWARVLMLAESMRQQLRTIDGVTVHDTGDRQCGIITFSVKGIESGVVKNRLAEKHINVSVGLAKSTLYYMEKQNLSSIVRASVHYYNTEEEIAIMCEVLKQLRKS